MISFGEVRVFPTFRQKKGATQRVPRWGTEPAQIRTVGDLVLNRLYRGAGERNGGGGDEWDMQTK